MRLFGLANTLEVSVNVIWVDDEHAITLLLEFRQKFYRNVIYIL